MRDLLAGRGRRIRKSVRLKRIFPFLLVLMVCSLLISPVYSYIPGTDGGTESIISTVTLGTDQKYPALWEDRIVWTHYYPDSMDSTMALSDIYLYNLTSGNGTKIPASLTYQEMPDIYKELIVWQTIEDNNYEIHLFNLSTGEERRLTDDQVHQIRPKIWGNWIVWQEGLEEESETGVFLYSIDSGNVTQLGDASSSAKSPDIWEDRVVWEDSRNGDGNKDIYYYNITTGTEVQITTDISEQESPSIWGDRIVWMDEQATSSQIYVFDFVTRNETCITSGGIRRESPHISGDYVAYVNDTVVSLVDLAAMTESPISADSTGSVKQNPAIWGNRVLWADRRNGDFDIFLFTIGISMPSLDAGFSTNSTQGTAPVTVAFTDTTSGHPQGWEWDFGDGNSSSEQNPVHTFETGGSYSVLLTVHNPYQRAAVRKYDLISIGSVPVPKFSQNTTGGPEPLAVQFTDESSGLPTSRHWSFGDGEESDEQNPVHRYIHPGVYDVILTVSNIFGNATLAESESVTVVNGTYYSCILPSDGIQIVPSNHLILNTTLAGTCSLESDGGAMTVVCDPGRQNGLDRIEFLALNGTEFFTAGTDIIEGDLQGVVIRSSTIGPLNMSQETGEQFLFNFTISPDQYTPGQVVPLIAWDGCIPDDFQRFDKVAFRYNSFLDYIAASVRFEVDSQSEGPATLVFAVSSDWVQEYGWSENRPLEIETNVPDAKVFVDDTYMGISPVVVTNLTPGEHQVKISKGGYYDTISTQVTGSDKRESIHVIRIGDDDAGEVLNTTFIGHDQERNLDIFLAESPNGLSTFGLASLSKSGNLFRLLYLVIAQSVQPQTGGSGGGTSSGVGNPAPNPTPVTTLTQGPMQTTLPTITQKAPESPTTTKPTGTGPLPTTGVPPVTPTVTPEQELNPMVLLKNLSVVFVVVLVTLVFYLRWNKREQ
jgi:beta propeller repeat protein